MVIDVTKLEAEVDKEVQDEAVAKAKTKLVAKRREIQQAKVIVTNLETEYKALLLELSTEIGV